MKPRRLGQRLPLWLRLSLRHAASNPVQTTLMVAGVALGVAVIVAIDIANQSAERAFLLSTEAIAGRATHQLARGPSGVPVAVYAQLRREGVRRAAPVIERLAVPTISQQPLTLIGVDPFADAPFRDYTTVGSGFSDSFDTLFAQSGTVLLSSETASALGVSVGDTFEIEIAGQRHPVSLAALIEANSPSQRRALASLIVCDIATAQELTGQKDTVDRVDLMLADEADLNGIEALLPPGFEIAAVGANSGPARQMIVAFQTNLYALSLLAMLVGMFLIFNTMTFSIVRRRPLIGTLRAIGVTRAEIFRGVCAEAILVAVVGTSIGIAMGIVLGRSSVDLVTQTINDLFYALTVRSVEIPPLAILKGLGVGLLAPLLAAALPAREAANAPPRSAMSRSAVETSAEDVVRRSAWGGLLLATLGTAILLTPSRNLWVAFGGLFSVVLGAAFAAPLATAWLMKAWVSATRRLFGTLGTAAARDVGRSLSRTSTAVAALMLAVSVAIGLRVMITSFRSTLAIWLEQSLEGDIYLSVPALGGTASTSAIDPRVIRYLQELREGKRLDLLRATTVSTDRGVVHLAASNRAAFDNPALYKSLSVARDEIAAELASGSLLVSEPLASRLDLSLGDELTLQTDVGPAPSRIVGIYYDYASSTGTVLMDLEAYRSRWSDQGVTAAALILEKGVSVDVVTESIAAAVAPIQLLRVRANRQLRADAFAVFDQAFAITRALVVLATAVAALGVLSALLALQLERRREFGILRAVGLTRRQAAAQVLLQTCLMGSAAAVIAVPTGTLLAVLLIRVINFRAFGWTLQMHIEAGPYLEAFALALGAATIAAMLPAFRMMRVQTSELLA